jgi:hypothetical protein
VLSLAVAAGLLVLAPAAPAAPADECGVTAPYPGDQAPKSDIAAWMARGAAARGIPGELPVMAALVESELRNLKSGDSDAKGYFQMRQSIWSAAYPGFPDDPELQLDWFLDQASVVRQPPYPTEAGWGEWAADVERPAAQYRYRYQLRLQDARTLIGAGCTPADTAPPETSVRAPARQRAVRARSIQVTVGCPSEPCTVEVRAKLRLGPRPTLAAPAATLVAGEVTTLRLKLKRPVRRLVAQAVARYPRVRADLTVVTTDAAGNAGTVTRRVRITG